MAENTELEILENLKKGMVDNTEGEVLENLKKVNESLCRVVHILQGPNSGETSDATKSISSTSLPRSSGPNTSSIFAEHQRLFGNAAVRASSRVNQITAALQFRPLPSSLRTVKYNFNIRVNSQMQCSHLIQTQAQKCDGMHINFDAVYQGDSKFARETSKTQTALIGSIFSDERNAPF